MSTATILGTFSGMFLIIGGEVVLRYMEITFQLRNRSFRRQMNSLLPGCI